MDVLFINDEECRKVHGFERYHVSGSGRLYRTTPLNNKEKRILEEGAAYVVEKQVFFNMRKNKLRQGTYSLTNAEGKLCSVLASVVIGKAFGVVSMDFNFREKSIVYLDGNKKNLNYTNIHEVDTSSQNYKLTKDDVRKIKRQIKEGRFLKDIANDFGVSDMQINRIKTGENWGNGKRKIKAPEAPFPIKDGKIRKFVAIFDRKPIDGKIKKPFNIKRNPEEPTDNLIYGIVNGYKLWHTSKNITRARVHVDWLNDYFFSKKEEKEPLFPEDFYKKAKSYI